MTRRGALLGAAALLGGCETLDNLFGERRQRFDGERILVLDLPERTLSADDAAQGTPVVLPAPAPRADWPLTGGDAAKSGGHVAFGPGLGQSWRSGFGSGTAYRRRLVAGPVAGGGSAFVADAFGEVSAFDIATGGRRWRSSTTRERESSGAGGTGVAFAGETVFVATGLSELLALNAADGAVRWRVNLPAPARGAPTVAAGRVFVPTLGSELLALSAEDGSRIWSHRAAQIATIPLGLGAPAVEGDTVLAGFPSGELFALRASDVDLRSGRRLWEQEAGGTEPAWVAGDWVFMTTDAGQALAIGRDSGQVRWAVSLRPAPRGNRPPERIALSAPVVAGGRVFIGTSRGELLALNPENGEVISRTSVPAGVTLPMAVAGGVLLAATDDATLLAFSGG
ncbi:MAG: PQQ-binding-like beta-propeller repeat protein [Solirubrobacteraceae bacterium]|nr:PQQ-binding-like beta-propeller repeat protein [Solirubrobacteraceae bacterium]